MTKHNERVTAAPAELRPAEDRLYERVVALLDDARLEALRPPDARLEPDGARVLRDRGGARELVDARARTSDRVAALRATRQEPRQGARARARAGGAARRDGERRCEGTARL